MEKVVGLIGSPRKLGNSELIVKEISRNVPEEHELVLAHLTKMDLKPCYRLLSMSVQARTMLLERQYVCSAR